MEDIEIYKKIILVKKWLNHSQNIERKNASKDIYSVINYVFDLFINSKDIDSKQRITKDMINEIDRLYNKNEIENIIPKPYLCNIDKGSVLIIYDSLFNKIED